MLEIVAKHSAFVSGYFGHVAVHTVATTLDIQEMLPKLEETGETAADESALAELRAVVKYFEYVVGTHMHTKRQSLENLVSSGDTSKVRHASKRAMR